jgi:apocytochrome f
MIYVITRTSISNAYPIFAQQGYENLREATGRIVCANCHLANKPVDIEVPQAVLLDTVFEAVLRIPYDMQLKQVLANGMPFLDVFASLCYRHPLRYYFDHPSAKPCRR